jgi:nanoRNase/pAp phosphatase (c-di-AMP/oligoRNAs hydrolase)
MRELESRFEISEEIDPYLREFWRNSKRVNLPIDGETTCIYSYLTAVNAKDTNVIQGAHRLFVPFQERFKNVELSFVLYPTAKENVYRVSFRSKQKLNVASLCESCFGGTGHEHAAGGHLKLEPEEIAELSRLKQSANFEEMNYVTSLILDKTVHYFQSHNHL